MSAFDLSPEQPHIPTAWQRAYDDRQGSELHAYLLRRTPGAYEVFLPFRSDMTSAESAVVAFAR